MLKAFSLLLLNMGACATAAAGTMPLKSERNFLKPEDFVILPWDWMPGDARLLGDIRECGFNLAGFVSPEHLDLVKNAGLKGIISGPSINEELGLLDEKAIQHQVDSLVRRARNHPAVFGYYLRDEPDAGLYPALKKWKDAYQKAAPKALAYINLFPDYATAKQLGDSSYENYLESYVQIVQPSFISYDHYALMDDGSLRAGYFQNLETVRRVAFRHNLPFWNIVLSNSHFNYAEPSDAGLRFQAYTTLAYGAKGISYFTYKTPTLGNYRLAPLDQFGNKTATWDKLRNVNLQIHALGPTYVTLRSVNVFHHPEVPKGCTGIETSRFVEKLKGGDFAVGEFEGKDSLPYLIVVNKSLQKSSTLTLTPKSPATLLQINAYTGNLEPFKGEGLWLAPGQGVMLCLKK